MDENTQFGIFDYDTKELIYSYEDLRDKHGVDFEAVCGFKDVIPKLKLNGRRYSIVLPKDVGKDFDPAVTFFDNAPGLIELDMSHMETVTSFTCQDCPDLVTVILAPTAATIFQDVTFIDSPRLKEIIALNNRANLVSINGILYREDNDGKLILKKVPAATEDVELPATVKECLPYAFNSVPIRNIVLNDVSVNTIVYKDGNLFVPEGLKFRDFVSFDNGIIENIFCNDVEELKKEFVIWEKNPPNINNTLKYKIKHATIDDLIELNKSMTELNTILKTNNIEGKEL